MDITSAHDFVGSSAVASVARWPNVSVANVSMAQRKTLGVALFVCKPAEARGAK